MFCREDIELIVNAMYKDELRNICEKINIMELRILEIIKLNSGFKRYLTKLFLIIAKVYYFFTKK
jgi:ethanolamine utilization cobalamin adenosyltransferase